MYPILISNISKSGTIFFNLVDDDNISFKPTHNEEGICLTSLAKITAASQGRTDGRDQNGDTSLKAASPPLPPQINLAAVITPSTASMMTLPSCAGNGVPPHHASLMLPPLPPPAVIYGNEDNARVFLIGLQMPVKCHFPPSAISI